MIKLLLITLILILLLLINFQSPEKRLTTLNTELNVSIHTKLAYKPKGYIYCTEMYGGFNNILEQTWFLNILAQKTNRGMVENKIKLIDKKGGPRVNLSEVINRDKYFSNLAVIQEQEFINDCGPYSTRIELPQGVNWYKHDQLEYMINLLNSLPDQICVILGFVPNYDFFGSSKFLNWVPTFKDKVLPNFEFSKIIQDQADYFIKENKLEDGEFISVQFRRGDYEQHCKGLFSYGASNWAFGMLYGDKFDFNTRDWNEFESHCYPSTKTLVSKITEIKSNLPTNITKTLLLTNANSVEINNLKVELNSKGLEYYRFEPKLELIPSDINWTITHSLLVEMELARRGKYLLGNRHSTINSNLIGLRLNQGLANNIFL